MFHNDFRCVCADSLIHIPGTFHVFEDDFPPGGIESVAGIVFRPDIPDCHVIHALHADRVISGGCFEFYIGGSLSGFQADVELIVFRRLFGSEHLGENVGVREKFRFRFFPGKRFAVRKDDREAGPVALLIHNPCVIVELESVDIARTSCPFGRNPVTESAETGTMSIHDGRGARLAGKMTVLSRKMDGLRIRLSIRSQMQCVAGREKFHASANRPDGCGCRSRRTVAALHVVHIDILARER